MYEKRVEDTYVLKMLIMYLKSTKIVYKKVQRVWTKLNIKNIAWQDMIHRSSKSQDYYY